MDMQSAEDILMIENPSFNTNYENNPINDPDSYMSWDVSTPVTLRMQPDGIASSMPITILKAFENTVLKTPRHIALVCKTKERTTSLTYTYDQYFEEIKKIAKCFIKLGLQRFHGVGIIGFNSPEWYIANYAAIFAGGLSVGIYSTNSPEACHFVAHDAKCNIVVVEDDTQLQKFLQIWPDLPYLKTIVQYKGKVKVPQKNIYTWDEMMNLDTSEDAQEFKSRMSQLSPKMCSSIIYTSGTTGTPKGVMLSHDNITWTARTLLNYAHNSVQRSEVIISYLPLSHIAAQILDVYGSMISSSTVHFAQPDALKGSLGQTIKEVRPTLFFGVPRVWEKMKDKIDEVSKSNGYLKQQIASWAKNIGYAKNTKSMNGQKFNTFCYQFAKKIIFSKIRKTMGFDRCMLFITGAAPITKEILNFFVSLDMPIMEVYGMSESTGPHSLGIPNLYRLCSVGQTIPGMETKFDKSSSDIDPEICFRGRHIFMGYHGEEQKTREVFDSEGFLHTGDAGKIDEKGFIWITGRLKEILITAGGENVAPIPIEDKVKEYLPCISNCMLIGDKRKFLTILLTFKTEINLDNMMPTNKLNSIALDWCKSISCNSVTDVEQIRTSKQKLIFESIQEGINKTNKSAISRAQIIQKWSILPRDFSIPGGELGPTLKLKRAFVNEMYKDVIEELYNE